MRIAPRNTTWIAAVGAICALGGFGAANWGTIVEHWNLGGSRLDDRRARLQSLLVRVVREDPDKEVREAAMRILAERGSGVGDEAIQAVVDSLEDYDMFGFP